MDIMLDLETLSSAPNAAVVSIGACTFNSNGELWQGERKTFYAVVDAADAQRHGGEIDARTVIWWMQQSEEARIVFTAPPSHPLMAALAAFTSFLSEFSEVRLWGNGADFDNVVLRRSYERAGIPAPWTFRQNRCYRTLKNIYPKIELLHGGVKHNALDDAIAQAEHAEHIFAALYAVENSSTVEATALRENLARVERDRDEAHKRMQIIIERERSTINDACSLQARVEKLEEALRDTEALGIALLGHFNPTNMEEGTAQQWFALHDQLTVRNIAALAEDGENNDRD